MDETKKGQLLFGALSFVLLVSGLFARYTIDRYIISLGTVKVHAVYMVLSTLGILILALISGTVENKKGDASYGYVEDNIQKIIVMFGSILVFSLSIMSITELDMGLFTMVTIIYFLYDWKKKTE